MTTTNETITIPLNKLDVDPLNVRKTYSADGIKELAATLGKHNVMFILPRAPERD